ncbi:F1F0 ATP synthase subunit e, mitochondrial [Knufia obscura]|uniref:ATP synthase F(0) complex subunit e, mitochondrial n=2 Tax=Knufia TaxID=430999 RepID=A0AAN8I7H3_9EURO|nr:F1F0 ATP synthase subunit e, mitochondrial [Knufia obscura]KAK5953256.1 F1F0 ATP synthase subunit e, mitochondrial [Knufia fluminis]
MSTVSTSQGANVLRWSALAFGIFYGFSHQRTINSQNHAAHAQAEWKHKEDLIQKAKLEWKKKQNPSAFTKGDDGVVTDPEDKNFDLEAYLQKISADHAK